MAGFEIRTLRYHTVGPVNLTVKQGECIGLTGASGSGKTLFLRACADLDPYKGDILLDGRNSFDYSGPEWRRTVGLLPADIMWWYDRVGAHFDTAVPEMLERLNLNTEVFSWPVERLSSGEKQRLGLVRLLANQPRVLLLDEPTANLDKENVKSVEGLISDWINQKSVMAIWVSHDPVQLKRVARRIFQLQHDTFNKLE